MSASQKKILQRFIILFAAVSVALFVYQSMRNFNRPTGNDLTIYLNASDELFHGVNPYHQERAGYIYPLFLAVTLYPLALIGKSVIAKYVIASVWALLSFAAFFWGLTATTSRLRKPWYVLRCPLDKQRDWTLIALMIVALHPFLQDEFLNSQINLLVIGLIAAYFVLLETGKSTLAGVILAVAASVKLAPAILILYALAQRRYRTVLVFSLTVPLLIIGIPLLVAPDALLYYKSYFSEVTTALTRKEAGLGYRSFSLLSTVTHAFALQLPAVLRVALTGALTLLLSIPVFLFFQRQSRNISAEQKLIVFALFTSIVPLVFPMSESHHLLILMFPLIVALAHCRELLEQGKSLWQENTSRILISAFAVLHLGQLFKATPLRFLGILGIYYGVLHLLNESAETNLAGDNEAIG